LKGEYRWAGTAKTHLHRILLRPHTRKGFSELLSVIKEPGSTTIFDREYTSNILNSLPSNNPFKTDIAQSIKLLKLLDLINESRVPTSHLLNLWGEKSVGRSEESRRPRRKRGQGASRGPEKIKYPQDIYVGNLDYNTTEEELKLLFEQFGEAVSVNIPPDYVRQRGRGFGFVKWLANRTLSMLSKC
jgi:RNA recognition motif-containing protein